MRLTYYSFIVSVLAFANKISPSRAPASQPSVQLQDEQEPVQAADTGQSPLQRMHSTIQAKLNIGEPGDQFEQEADDTAARVMQKPASVQRQTEQPEDIQQMSGEEAAVSTKSFVQTRLFDEEKDVPGDMLNAKELSSAEASDSKDDETIQTKASDHTAGAAFENRLNSAKGGGDKLPADTQAEMENRFGGKDFSNVRIHTDSASAQMNKEIKSKAFTNENHIFFNSGQYSNGQAGKELLAHELTHTVQQGATEDKLQRKTDEGFHREDGDVPEQKMKEKQKEELGDDYDQPLSEEEKAEGRPDDASEEKAENQAEIEEEGEAKPPVDREAESAPKINESVDESKKEIEEKPEAETPKEEEKIPEEKKELSPSEQAAVLAEEAFANAEKVDEPKEKKPVKIPNLEPVTDAGGEELPMNPMLMKVPMLAAQIQMMRDQAHEQEVKATEQEAGAEEMRGSIQTIYSKIYDSNDYLDIALERTNERKVLLTDLDENLAENEKRTQKVAEEAPKQIEGTAETKDTVLSSADVSEEQESEGSKLSDPDMEEESEDTSEQTAAVTETLEGTPEHAETLAQTPHQLIADAAAASEKHGAVRGEMAITSEKITTTEADIIAKKQHNAEEKAKVDQTISIPDEISKEAKKIKKRAKKTAKDSEKREDKLHRIYKRYVDRMKGTPASLSLGHDNAAGQKERFIQRQPEDAEAESIIPGALTDEQKIAYETNRDAFMANVDNDYAREMIDLEMSLQKDFESMNNHIVKENYALEWTRLHWMHMLSEINWVHATADVFLILLSPYHLLKASVGLMSLLLFPPIPKDDPFLMTSLRVLASAVSIVSVIFGTLLGLSAWGFGASVALSFIPWFTIAMVPWIIFFKFQMVTWGGLFLWWTAAAAALQAAVFLIDLKRAGVSDSADALQANSNQLAADSDQASVSVGALAFMKLFGLGGKFFKNVKNRKTGGVDKKVNTKKTTRTGSRKTGQVNESAGGEFLDDFARMTEKTVETKITGNPDFPHEGPQAMKYGNMKGGGTFEFGQSQMGVEGTFTPTGSQIKQPVSMKQMTTANPKNVFREIRQNGQQVQKAGAQGQGNIKLGENANTTLYIENPNITKAEMLDFIKSSNNNIFPDEGIFNEIIIATPDGTIKFNAKNQIIK